MIGSVSAQSRQSYGRFTAESTGRASKTNNRLPTMYYSVYSVYKTRPEESRQSNGRTVGWNALLLLIVTQGVPETLISVLATHV